MVHNGLGMRRFAQLAREIARVVDGGEVTAAGSPLGRWPPAPPASHQHPLPAGGEVHQVAIHRGIGLRGRLPATNRDSSRTASAHGWNSSSTRRSSFSVSVSKNTSSADSDWETINWTRSG